MGTSMVPATPTRNGRLFRELGGNGPSDLNSLRRGYKLEALEADEEEEELEWFTIKRRRGLLGRTRLEAQ